MKILNLILAVVFLIFALLQLNDPDAIEWTSLYGVAALICAFGAFNKYNRWVILLLMAMCIYEMSSRVSLLQEWFREGMPTITGSMKAATPYVENVREFLGVAIVLVIMLFQYTRSRILAVRRQRTHGGTA